MNTTRATMCLCIIAVLTSGCRFGLREGAFVSEPAWESNFRIDMLRQPRDSVLPEVFTYTPVRKYSPDGKYCLVFPVLPILGNDRVVFDKVDIIRVEDGTVVDTIPYRVDVTTVYASRNHDLPCAWLPDALVFMNEVDPQIVVVDLLTGLRTNYKIGSMTQTGSDDSTLYFAPSSTIKPYSGKFSDADRTAKKYFGSIDIIDSNDVVALQRSGARLLRDALRPCLDAMDTAEANPDYKLHRHEIKYWDRSYAVVFLEYVFAPRDGFTISGLYIDREMLLANGRVAGLFPVSYPLTVCRDTADNFYYFSSPCPLCDSSKSGLYRVLTDGTMEKVLLTRESETLSAWPRSIDMVVWGRYIVLLLMRELGPHYTSSESALFFYDTRNRRFVQAPEVELIPVVYRR